MLIRKIIAACAVTGFVATMSCPTVAAGKQITISQALTVLGALRNLDGHQVIVKVNGQDTVVFQPWDFGSAVLRLKIASDINVLTAVETSQNNIRQTIIKEITKDKPPGFQIAANSPEMDEFTRQYNDLLAQPAAGSEDLAHISAAELKLDKNEIPPTTIAGLGPILDH